jgi:hypothetical protein
MKRSGLYALTFAVLLSGAAAAQTRPPTPTRPPQPPAQTAPAVREMTVVGCIAKGSRPNSYLIDRAVDRTKKNDPPRTFRIQPLMEDPDFETDVNAWVELTGTAELKPVPPPPPGRKIDETALPIFTVKSFQRVADTCSFWQTAEKAGTRTATVEPRTSNVGIGPAGQLERSTFDV